MKQATPLVSIIMPAFNASNFISLSIESVLSQTYEQWELLIVNDCSSDSTLKIAQDFAKLDTRILVFDQIKNGGVSKARNRAIEEARGRFIAFLDSDDLWDPDKLEKQLRLLDASGKKICYSYYRRIDENGEVIGAVHTPSEVTYSQMLKSNFIGNLTGIYNAEELGKQFLTEFRHEDYIAWLSLLKKAHSAVAVEEQLASYRVYSGSLSSDKLRVIRWQWRIYRESQQLSLIYSAWLMVCYGYFAIMKRSG